MTIQEAIKDAMAGSHKLRRRSYTKRVIGGDDAWLDVSRAWNDRFFITAPVPVFESGKLVDRATPYQLFIEDILADDWEVKP